MTDHGTLIVLGLLCVLGPVWQIVRRVGRDGYLDAAVVDWFSKQTLATLMMWRVTLVFGWILLLLGVAPR